MEKIKVLIVYYYIIIAGQLLQLLNGAEIADCKILAEAIGDFDRAKELLAIGNYDVVILDVYRGGPSEENTDLAGREVLETIKTTAPLAVIFYTGLTSHVQELASDVVRVLSKTGGNIENELKLLLETGIPLMRQKITGHVNEILKDYYWEFIDKNSSLIQDSQNKALSEYLLLRRLAATLTRDGVHKIFGDAISSDKIHPLEFYIFPPIDEAEFETGDILEKDGVGSFHVVLTPSCDFANHKASFILLVNGTLLKETDEYISYAADRSNVAVKETLSRVIGSRRGDRYFFLPRSELMAMPDLVLDFQNLTNHQLEGFSGYKKIGRIDDPFVQDMLATFIRNQNRPGSPDLDVTYILDYINKDIDPPTQETIPQAHDRKE